MKPVGLVAVPLLAAVLGAQSPGGIFRVEREGGEVTVAANVIDVACDRALAALAEAVGWKLRFELEDVAPAHGASLVERLAAESVELAFEAMDPRDVASLIAVVAGAEVRFRQLPPPGLGGEELVVTEVPDPHTAAGAGRLRERAMHWYRRFLERSPRAASRNDAANLRTRVRYADALRETGEPADLAAAVRVLDETLDLAPDSELAAPILLRIAECFDERGAGFERETERRLRWLIERYPDSPAAAAAAVRFGRFLFEQGEYAACEAELEQAWHLVAARPERTDLQILLAAARHALGRDQDCAATLAELAADGAALSPAQRDSVDFLGGSAAVGLGRHDEAVRRLETFLGRAPADDRRRAFAWVQIGRAWHALGRHLHARLAAQKARQAERDLDRDQAALARQLWLRATLATEPYEDAILDLEAELVHEPETHAELAPVLGAELIERGYFAKAAQVLEPFARREDALGDECRVLLIRRTFEECRRAGALHTFAERARPLAAAIRSVAHQRRAAELFARAFEAAGDPIRAARAREGVIR